MHLTLAEDSWWRTLGVGWGGGGTLMYHYEPRSVVSARAAYSQYDPCLVVHGVTKDDLEERLATRMKSMLIWITALGLIAP